MSTHYLVKNGLNYRTGGRGKEKRVEPGEIVDDLPKKSLRWLLDRGYVEVLPDQPDENGEEDTE